MAVSVEVVKTYIEVVRTYVPVMVEAFIQIESRLFSEVLTDHEYYRKFLENPRNVVAVLIEDKGCSVVGYACARPYNDAVQDLGKYDPVMESHDIHEGIYFEMMAILPMYRGRKHRAFLQLIATVFHEVCRREGLENSAKLSFHARVSNELYKKVSEIFPEIRIIREIDNWLGTEEKTVYMEGELSDKSVKMLREIFDG